MMKSCYGTVEKRVFICFLLACQAASSTTSSGPSLLHPHARIGASLRGEDHKVTHIIDPALRICTEHHLTPFSTSAKQLLHGATTFRMELQEKGHHPKCRANIQNDHPESPKQITDSADGWISTVKVLRETCQSFGHPGHSGSPEFKNFQSQPPSNFGHLTPLGCIWDEMSTSDTDHDPRRVRSEPIPDLPGNVRINGDLRPKYKNRFFGMTQAQRPNWAILAWIKTPIRTYDPQRATSRKNAHAADTADRAANDATAPPQHANASRGRIQKETPHYPTIIVPETDEARLQSALTSVVGTTCVTDKPSASTCGVVGRSGNLRWNQDRQQPRYHHHDRNEQQERG